MYYIIATSQQTEVGKMEAVTHFLFLGSRIPAMVTADVTLEDDCLLAGKL